MPTAIIYARYSPRPEQDDPLAEAEAAAEDAATIQLQVEVCQRYATMKGLAVAEVIKDPETSARKTPLFEREGGSRLRDLPPGSHIVCAKLARMFRNVDDGRATFRHFEQHSITLHFADEGGVTINTTTARGKLVATMLLAVNEHEPEETAERTSKGMKHRQRHGQRMTHATRIPYGSKLDPNDSRKTVPCAEELQAGTEARSLREQGWSLGDIALAIGPIRGRILSRQGVKDLMTSTLEGVTP